MSKPEAEGYVSVIGTALVQPLLELIERLESWPPAIPNEVKTGQRENGYSLAIIVLALNLFESALNRAAYVRNEKSRGPNYFKTLCPGSTGADEIEEVYAVRNVIVHNHIWEAKFTWDEDNDMTFIEEPKLREGCGDNRHLKVMDPKTRKSRLLKINMFPSRIWRRDAYIAVKMIAKGLDQLESIDRKYFYLSPHHFRFQKKTATFNEVMDSLLVPEDV